jgi:hypothetical protein
MKLLDFDLAHILGQVPINGLGQNNPSEPPKGSPKSRVKAPTQGEVQQHVGQPSKPQSEVLSM